MTNPKMPPQDLDAERTVLGSILLDNALLDVALQIVGPQDFAATAHQHVFRGMMNLARAQSAIDTVTLSAELERTHQLEQIGGRAFVCELIMEVGSPSNIVSRARIVREHAMNRGLTRVAFRLQDLAYAKADALHTAEQTIREISTLVWNARTQTWEALDTVLPEYLMWIEQLRQRADDTTGTTTGLLDLDAMLGGWQASDLIIVGARPGMGKTAFALTAAHNAARVGAKVAIVSLEMSKLQLINRLIARESLIDIWKLRQPRRLSDGERMRVSQAAISMSALPIVINDASTMSLEMLRVLARQQKHDAGLDLLIVDYLQLMDLPSHAARHVGFAEITRGLKLLAKELDCAVMCLSQLNRASIHRDDPRPRLEDLRESGAIEQDADIVLMLYRDELYHEDSEHPGVAELLLRKHRNGPIGRVEAAFVDRFASFENLSPYGAPEGTHAATV